MKRLLAIIALALSSISAETLIEWNIQSTEAFSRAQIPVPPGMFDAVVVFAWERVQIGGAVPTGFIVRVEFTDGVATEAFAKVQWPACTCAGARIPIPKGTPSAAPRSIRVTPVVIHPVAPAAEVNP